jgi:hypothetical protein
MKINAPMRGTARLDAFAAARTPTLRSLHDVDVGGDARDMVVSGRRSFSSPARLPAHGGTDTSANLAAILWVAGSDRPGAGPTAAAQDLPH